jgi:serine protease Do
MRNSSRFVVAAILVGAGLVLGYLIASGQPPAIAQPMLGPPVTRELTSYRDIVKKIVPAVVSIETKAKLKVRPAQRGVIPMEAQLPNGIPLGFGSGLIVDPNGVVLTNYHVVEGADTVDVNLPDGRKFTSSDIKLDRKTDLAIIRFKSDRPLPYLEFANSDEMEVGDRVLAVGAPFGLTSSVTHGIISAKSRSLRLNQYEDFLQTDAAINPGNSGGPLVNLEGKVIGINSAIKSRSGGFQGVGLAISSNLARSIMKQLLEVGSVKRAYLGVSISDVDDRAAKRLNIPQSGVIVTGVVEGSPAGKGGLKQGDVILRIDGKEIKDGQSLSRIIATLPVNAPSQVAILRSNTPMILPIVMEEQPEEFGLPD